MVDAISAFGVAPSAHITQPANHRVPGKVGDRADGAVEIEQDAFVIGVPVSVGVKHRSREPWLGGGAARALSFVTVTVLPYMPAA